MDGYVSIKRIQKFLLTEDTVPLPPIDKSHESALDIEDADFYWDQLPSTTSVAAALSSDGKQGATTTSVPESTSSSTAPSSSRNSTTEDSEASERQPLLSASNNTAQESASRMKPFLRDINLHIPRGSLVAIVGPVGSGKSSLLQAMVGNMTKARGEVTRGATMSYASQTPWIQNATIMDNILFDTPMEEERYWRVIKA
ncbi:hypothetical protein BGZ96_006436, partial [Linnemannia gamsii]